MVGGGVVAPFFIMRRKDKSVSLQGLALEMLPILIVVDAKWRRHGQEAVITAGTEAFKDDKLIHSAGSLHPFGRALDFRTFYFDLETQQKIRDELLNELSDDYDIILHKSHIHIEYDP